MNLLSTLFNTVLYQPLFNILIFLYVYLPGQDLGIAVIIFTLIIKLVLLPSSTSALKTQLSLSRLQPKIQEIQQKYKNDKVKQSQEMMEIYRREKISPFSGCLPMIFQLPILIALYQVFLKGFSDKILSQHLYSFMPPPGAINPSFLGLLDLSQPNIYLAVLAGILQYVQVKLSTRQQAFLKTGQKGALGGLQKQMLYFFPVFAVLILWRLSAIIAFYWITTTIFTILEQWFVTKKYHTENKYEPERT